MQKDELKKFRTFRTCPTDTTQDVLYDAATLAALGKTPMKRRILGWNVLPLGACPNTILDNTEQVPKNWPISMPDLTALLTFLLPPEQFVGYETRTYTISSWDDDKGPDGRRTPSYKMLDMALTGKKGFQMNELPAHIERTPKHKNKHVIDAAGVKAIYQALGGTLTSDSTQRGEATGRTQQPTSRTQQPQSSSRTQQSSSRAQQSSSRTQQQPSHTQQPSTVDPRKSIMSGTARGQVVGVKTEVRSRHASGNSTGQEQRRNLDSSRRRTGQQQN